MRRAFFLALFISILSPIWLLFFFLLSPTGSRSHSSVLIADDFDFPFDNPSQIIGYDIHPSFSRNTCFGVDIRHTWHAGEDWFAPAGTTVKAVANGTVRYVHPIERDYPGSVVIVEHELIDGTTVYSMYGHLREPPPVSVGQTVQKGTPVGYILDQDGNSHLHWEIRSFFDGSFICNNELIPGPGYTYPGHPDEFGYTDPADFIDNHRLIILGVTLFDLPNYVILPMTNEKFWCIIYASRPPSLPLIAASIVTLGDEVSKPSFWGMV